MNDNKVYISLDCGVIEMALKMLSLECDGNVRATNTVQSVMLDEVTYYRNR